MSIKQLLPAVALINNLYRFDQKVSFDREPGRTHNLQNFLSGGITMTTWNYNQAANNTDQSEAIQRAVEMALYYPSSEGKSWDEELQPSGD